MRIQATTTQSGAASNTSNASQVAQTKSLGKEEFLKLLVTQLRYQDPLQPMEDKAFIAQLAQFSSLEQMQNLNQNIESFLGALQLTSALGQAAGLIGKEVTVLDPRNGQEVTGRVVATRFFDGVAKIVIGEEMYDLSWIKEIRA